MTKQYDERNAMALGEYYGRHVHAMTVESLHAKSDIAAELGWRDKRIDELLAALEEKDQQLARYSMSAGQADQRLCESRAVRIALGFGEDAIDVAPTDLVEAIQAIRSRSEAAEQREGHLKADAAVMGQRIADLEVTQMTGPLSLVLKRAAELERIIEGVDQLAIDGGWTARKMSEYAKSLETRNAELEQRLQQPIKLPESFYLGRSAENVDRE